MNDVEFNLRAIPEELRALPQWVCFDSATKGADGKKPLTPHFPARGKLGSASTKEPETWAYFDEAEARVSEGLATGVGFVFSGDDPYAGIDLDSCVFEGKITPWAANIIALFDSYTEFSPSGHGIHIIVKGVKPDRGLKWACEDTLKGVPGYRSIEIDRKDKYYRFTGNVVPGTNPTIQDRGPRLTCLAIRNANRVPLAAIAADGFTSNRNDAFTSIGGLLRTNGCSDDQVENCLHLINQTCNRPPAPEEEISSIARSVCKYPPGKAKSKQAALDGIEMAVSDSRGGITPCLSNAVRILPHLEGYDGLYFNEFDRKLYLDDEQLTDNHALELQEVLEIRTTKAWGLRNIFDAMTLVANRRKKHQLRTWLDSLVWDGTPRLSTFLARYTRDPGNAHVGTTGRKFLIAAVNRIFKPGCYMPHVLLLIGPQRAGKSRLGAILAGDYFADGLSDDLTNKDSAISLRGKWIVEMPEMSCMRKTDLERAKFFISRQVDDVRDPYARMFTSWPRQCVFIGTTNEQFPLHDKTGNRRFWPVTVPASCDQSGLIAERDQLWAEAVAAFKGGEKWWEFEKEWEDSMVEKQHNAVESDAWENDLVEYLNREKPSFFSVRDLLGLALNIELPHMTISHSQRVGTCISSLISRGLLPYHKKRVTVGGITRHGYVRNADAEPGKPLIKPEDVV